jgi:hypothetical protein
MLFVKSGIIILLIAIASPAAAQTADEMKARIAALEKENAKLRERLTSRGPTSVPRKHIESLRRSSRCRPSRWRQAAAPPPRHRCRAVEPDFMSAAISAFRRG